MRLIEMFLCIHQMHSYLNRSQIALHHHRYCKSSACINNNHRNRNQILSYYNSSLRFLFIYCASSKTQIPLDRGFITGGRKKTLNPKRVKTGWCLGVGFLSTSLQKSALYEGCDNTSLRAPQQHARDLNNDRP